MGRRRAAVLTSVVLLAIGVPCCGAQAQDPTFSSWDVQGLYGRSFREPGVAENVSKGIVTFENAAGWSWGSSYFFADLVRSDGADGHASEVYSEWFPSASLSKLSGRGMAAGIVRDVSVTFGINAGAKSTGAAPIVFLPGTTFDLKLPAFAVFSIGVYAYVDRGRLEGKSNGCHGTTFQVTPSWALPFSAGGLRFSLDGFVDFIGSHADCASQVISQAQFKLNVGPRDRLYVGVEWQYSRRKFGIAGLDESFPQALIVWKF